MPEKQGAFPAALCGALTALAESYGTICSICCALLAALALSICLDLLVEYAAAAGLGAEFPALIARLLAFYIAVNECISITENLSACGVRLPGFLAAAFGSARDKLDQR